MTHPTPSRALMTLATGYWDTQAVYVAAELGVADQLAGRALTATELAPLVGADPDALDRLLNFLVGKKVLTGDSATGFALTEVGELLRAEHPATMRDLARFYGNEFYRAWGNLLHSVRTGGEAFEPVLGDELFPYLDKNIEASLRFDGAMAAGQSFFGDVPRAYDFSRARTVLDIAGGNGSLLGAILRANPGVRGTVLDRQQVLEANAPELAKQDYADRLDWVAGDFFESVPGGCDIYILSRILHDWSDERCLDVLANCQRAMAPGSTLLLLERLVPADGEPSLAYGFSLHMLAVMGGGRERTEREYATLLHRAGFDFEQSHALPLDTFLLSATRR